MKQDYPIKYKGGKAFIYVGIGLLVLVIPAVCLLPGLWFGFLILFLLLLGILRYTVVGYREVWLYEDKLQVVDIFGNYFYEIYYDNIANLGFVNTVSTVSNSRYNNYSDEYKSSELVILLKDGDRKEIRRPGLDALKEICAFIKDKIIQDGLQDIPAKDHGQSIPERHYGDMAFESSKNGLYICAGLAVSVIICSLFLAMTGLDILIPLLLIILLVTLATAKGFYTDFRSIVILSDRIAIRNFSKKVLQEIYYKDIDHVGFLHSSTFRQYSTDDDSEGVRLEKLIILMKDGNRETIDDDISNIHDLCAYIQEQIKQI